MKKKELEELMIMATTSLWWDITETWKTAEKEAELTQDLEIQKTALTLINMRGEVTDLETATATATMTELEKIGQQIIELRYKFLRIKYHKLGYYQEKINKVLSDHSEHNSEAL